MIAARHLAAALALTLLLSACGDREPPAPADQAIRPARIFEVTADVAIERHEFVGRVDAAQTIDMTFRVPGQLVALPVLEGQSIQEGALIAAIDPTDYALALREAEVQRELARQDLARKRKLLVERGISQSLVDDAKALFDLRQVAVEQARENLDRTKLRAPFDAYVARRFTDNHVNVRVGDPIVRLTDLNELFIVTSVPEDLLATATPDRVLGIRARFPFLPDERFELAFRENTGESNAVAQTFEITFVMPRPAAWNILPGMTATVEVQLAAAGDAAAIEIPAGALTTDPEMNYYVWLYDPETRAVSKRPVSIGPAGGRGISIRSGLAPGDLIVATGAAHLTTGMRVRMLGEPVTRL